MQEFRTKIEEADEALKQIKQNRGIDVGISIAKHDLAHIQHKGHREDKGMDLVRSISRYELELITDVNYAKEK